jgi:LysR family glycine cleavage system transcriptional activator
MHALRAFESVSRHLNYQLAAEELRVTPAAVKQLVSKLEAALDTRLLRRKGRGLELTQEGKAGQEDLGIAMRYIASSVVKMRLHEAVNKMIVSVESSFATAWLVPRLEEFRAKHPQINVLIDSSQRIVDLRRSEVDVAIRYGVERDDGLIVHRLFDDQIFPACSPAFANGPPKLGNLEDLADVTLIHWDISDLVWARETRRWFTWESWFAHAEANHLATERGLHFNDYGLAVQAAVAGQGVVLASWPILRDPISAGLLTCPFREAVTTDIGYDLVTTAHARLRPEVDAFIAWLIDAADREQQRDVDV